jgi:hypothetical protein
MINAELINSINNLANSVQRLESSIRVTQTSKWWDTQWFSALVGAIAGLIGTFLYSSLKNRSKKLSDSYQWFLEQGTFSDPSGLLMQANITVYGNEDKPLAEKMVIELRSHTKYWYNPYGTFRFLLRRYEKSIMRIKNGRTEEVKMQPEYLEAEKRFKKVMDFLYRKTGENEWTS